MKKSKKIFLGIASFFFLFLGFVIYDISRKTTFPGVKSNINEEAMDGKIGLDTAKKEPKR